MRIKWLILTLSLLVGAQTVAQEIELGVNDHRLHNDQPVHSGDNMEVLGGLRRGTEILVEKPGK